MERASPGTASPSKDRLLAVAVFFFLVIALIAVYSPSLRGPFTLDDIRQITDNPSVKITRLDLPSLLGAASPPEHLGTRRPVAHVTFGLDYFFSADDPFGYRLTNLAILLLCLPAALGTAFLLARTLVPRDNAVRLAMAAIVLWSLNPVMTNGVSYIVQRMTSLSALFSLLCLAFFLHARRTGRRRWYYASLLGWLFALGSKETAILTPLVALLSVWLAPRSEKERALAGRLLVAAVVASQAGLLLFALFSGWHANRPFTITERALTEGRVVLRYLTLFLLPLPSRLNFDYDFPLSTSLLSPAATLPAFLFHAALIALALRVRKGRPLFAFSILAFYLLQLLESTFLPIAIIFEHRLFFPSFFLSLALIDAALALAKALPLHRPERTVLYGALAVGLLWGNWTGQRNKVWGDQEALWRDVVAKSPGHFRAHNNLGVTLLREGKAREAVRHLERALELLPGYAEAHNNMGNALLRLGDRSTAEKEFLHALEIDAGHAEAHNNLGNLLLAKGDLSGAVSHYEKALKNKPWSFSAHHNLGLAQAGLGRFPEALEAYGRAVELDPGNAEILYNMGVAYARSGRLEEASRRFSEAIRLRPGHAASHYNLGIALAKSGRTSEAIGRLEEALRLDPENTNVRLGLARVRSLAGRSAE